MQNIFTMHKDNSLFRGPQKTCRKERGPIQGPILSDVKPGSLLLQYKCPYMKGIFTQHCQSSQQMLISSLESLLLRWQEAWTRFCGEKFLVLSVSLQIPLSFYPTSKVSVKRREQVLQDLPLCLHITTFWKEILKIISLKHVALVSTTIAELVNFTVLSAIGLSIYRCYRI